VDPRAGLENMKRGKFLILQRLELRPLGRPSKLNGIFNAVFIKFARTSILKEISAFC
jgi:hypothetical protein